MPSERMIQAGLDTFLEEVIGEQFTDPQVKQSIDLAFWGGAYWVMLVLEKHEGSKDAVAAIQREIQQHIKDIRAFVNATKQ